VGYTSALETCSEGFEWLQGNVDVDNAGTLYGVFYNLRTISIVHGFKDIQNY